MNIGHPPIRRFHSSHHCQPRVANLRPMLGCFGLWAGRSLDHATPPTFGTLINKFLLSCLMVIPFSRPWFWFTLVSFFWKICIRLKWALGMLVVYFELARNVLCMLWGICYVLLYLKWILLWCNTQRERERERESYINIHVFRHQSTLC